MLTREELTEEILAAKQTKHLKWSAIAEHLGTASPIFYTAALLGQQTLTLDEAEKATELLGLPPEAVLLLSQPPRERGATAMMPPTDPLIYRFYELVQNYGSTWKALIEEEFGDGIMSAIDFNMSMRREPHPAGDRVHLEMSGKFLPYRRF